MMNRFVDMCFTLKLCKITPKAPTDTKPVFSSFPVLILLLWLCPYQNANVNLLCRTQQNNKHCYLMLLCMNKLLFTCGILLIFIPKLGTLSL